MSVAWSEEQTLNNQHDPRPSVELLCQTRGKICVLEVFPRQKLAAWPYAARSTCDRASDSRCSACAA